MIDAATTKQRLLDVAEDLALRKGFWNTSFADICQIAGINRGNFYYHFRTKRDLLEQVIERRLDMVAESLELIENTTDNPRQRLNIFFTNLCEKRDVYVNYGCPIGGLALELAKQSPEHLPILENGFKLTLGWLETQFSNFSDTPRENAYHVHQVYQGAIVQAAAMKSMEPLAIAERQLHAWVATL